MKHPLGIRFNNISKIYKGDFDNKEDLKIIFEENQVDYVFHFICTTVLLLQIITSGMILKVIFCQQLIF